MDYKILDIGPATSLITNIDLEQWGSKLIISLIYDPLGSSKPYQIVFYDCRKIEWQVIRPDNVEENTLELIGIIVGKGEYQSPSVITTDLLEIIVHYKELVVAKSW